MMGFSSEVFSPVGDSPREAFVLSWNFAGAVVHSLVTTDTLAVHASLYRGKGQGRHRVTHGRTWVYSCCKFRIEGIR